ncbi:MAG: hypothetical protein ABJB74_08980 [Gemmatimonas sp.]
MALPVERLAVLPLALGLGVLLWDILLAGWIASQRQASRPFTALTGLCGLLVAPAALVAMATVLESTARTMVGIAWIWPLVTVAFAVQVAYALFARLLTPAVALPLLLYDCCVATIAVSDYIVSISGSAPIWLQGAVGARDAVAGFAVGRSALVSPLAVLVPMIAPAFPARWKASAGVRAVLTLAATAATTLLLMQWPQTVGAIRSYDAAIGVRLQERPARDFAIGLRMYSRLEGAPAARLIKADLKLADTLKARAMLVVLTEKGTRAPALDSLARILEPWRADSGIIAIALELENNPGPPNSAQRAATIERIVLRLRPDVFIPGWRAPLPALLRSREPDVAWWKVMLTSTANVITRVRPRTQLGWSAARVDTRDSVVYDWASSPESPVRVLGIVSYPSFAGLPAVDARLRAFERWHDLATARYNAPRAYWLMEVGGLPRAHGDAAQSAAIMQSLAWGTRHSWVTVAILGDAADYDASNGLRAADGRERQVVGVVSRASRGLRESGLGTR